MQWTFRRSTRLGGYPRKDLGQVDEKVHFRFLGLVPFIENEERGSCLEGRRTENKSDKGEKGTLIHHGLGAFQSSSQVTGLGYTVIGRKELEGFTEGFRSEKELEFNAENYLSRKLSHTVNPRKSKLETGKAAETKSLPNSGRISPEKQRLPVSTKLASCPGDSVSRRRSSAPPSRFKSEPALTFQASVVSFSRVGPLTTRPPHPGSAPAPLPTRLRDPGPASCLLSPRLGSPARSPLLGHHIPSSVSRLPPRRSRLGLSVLDPPPVLRAPQLQPGLRSPAGRCRASTPPARPPTPPDRVSSSTASVLVLAPVVVAEQRILRPDRAHLLRHPRAAAGPDRSLGRVLGLEGWRELAQG